ncbi:TonB-dependent hemoglobin/transferrin/lactoferrin receptor family protein [Herbaspirillum sp. YR522]|nr:TonB-dependent hemoglobin/transferrin/lactoferrin receptor family protein [Herbaspirillum sp. YR522]
MARLSRVAATRRWRTSLRPLTLTLAVHAALMSLAAPLSHAQQAAAGIETVEPGATRTQQRKLPDVQIEAAREEQHKPGAINKITKDELERQGATSFGDVLKYQPLVSVPGLTSGGTKNTSAYDHPGSTNYNIRGVEGNRVGVDVDDVEMPEAVDRSATSGSGRASVGSFGQGRDFIDPEMFSEVQVDSGTTTAARPAGGIGGAVSFRTKSADDFVNSGKPYYAGVKAGYNSADRSWHEAITGAGSSGMFDGLIVYSHRDGHQTDNNSDILGAYPSHWTSHAVLLKGGMRLDAEHRLTLSADFYRRRNDLSYSAWNTAATAVTGRSRQDSLTERETIQLAHLWTPSNGWLDRLETRLSYQDTDMQDRTNTTTLATGVTDDVFSRNRNKLLSLSSTATKKIANNSLRFGANLSRNRNEHALTGTAFSSQPYPNTETTKLGLFAEDEIVFDLGGHRLAILPGLRVDRTRNSIYDTDSFGNTRITGAQLETLYGGGSTNTIVSPSLSVVYDILPRVSAYAQWKRSGRAPSVSELYGYWNGGGGTYALIGNRNLQKETSDAFDIGLKGAPVDGITFNSSLFYTKYKNFIAYTRYGRALNPEMFTDVQAGLSTIYQAENRDDAYIYGVELSTRIDAGKLVPALSGVTSTWALGYSQGKSKSRYAGDSYQDLESVQPAKLIVGLGYDAPEKQWGTNLTGIFVRGKQAKSNYRNLYQNAGAALPDSTVVYYRVPGYASFDLTGYWRVARNVRITAGINNLLDKRYWDYASARSLEPSVAKDAQDIQLQTRTGRSMFAAVAVDF